MLNSAKQILAKIASKHGADYLEKIPVVTGNRARVVDAGDGKIWVRFSTGLEARVINTLAPLAPDRHITIGRLRTSPNVWRVAEVREVYIESDSSQFMPHHLQHEFGGFDQVNINRKQIISATAFVSDPANFLVRVYGGLFQTDSGWVLAQSTDGTPAHPDLDLSAEVPTAGAVYVGIESDDTGALSLNVGTPFAAPELATGADVPIPPDGSRLIAFVLLYDSQVELLDSDISVPGLFASAPGGGTGAAAWGNITGTLSDQTDLQSALDGKQPLDSDLTAIASLSPTDDDIIQRKAGGWTNRTLAQLSTDMTELTQDLIGGMVSGNVETGITVTYDDPAGKLDFSVTPAGVGAIPNDGWIATSVAVTSGTLDSPSFELSFAADMTALIGLGDRIKLTQSTTKYFIVTKVGAFGGGATVITVYGGTDYTLVPSGTTAISNVFYSHVKIPFGFPVDPEKWTVSLTDTSNASQASPAVGTYYNLGSLSISIPIGKWRTFFSLTAGIVLTTTALRNIGVVSALSTANNSASDNELRVSQQLTGPTGANSIILLAVREKVISHTSKTTHYLVCLGSVATDTLTSIAFRGDLNTTVVRCVCAYL